MNKKNKFECQPGTLMTESVCPGAKVRASVHRDGHKNRPVYISGKLIHKHSVINFNTSLQKCVVDGQWCVLQAGVYIKFAPL